MPKNASVIDKKPSNSGVKDMRPNHYTVLNVKPSNYLITDQTQVYTESRTIRAGQPMGLLLTLSYPSAFTFTATRS